MPTMAIASSFLEARTFFDGLSVPAAPDVSTAAVRAASLSPTNFSADRHRTVSINGIEYTLFDGTYIPMGQQASEPTKAEAKSRGTHRAIFGYYGRSDAELEFVEGEFIEIKTRVNDHWFFGYVVGREGIEGFIPASYITANPTDDASVSEDPAPINRDPSMVRRRVSFGQTGGDVSVHPEGGVTALAKSCRRISLPGTASKKGKGLGRRYRPSVSGSEDDNGPEHVESNNGGVQIDFKSYSRHAHDTKPVASATKAPRAARVHSTVPSLCTPEPSERQLVPSRLGKMSVKDRRERDSGTFSEGECSTPSPVRSHMGIANTNFQLNGRPVTWHGSPKLG